MPLGCSFAGQWALLPVPQRPGGCGGIWVPMAEAHVHHQRCRDVQLQSQLWSCYTGSDPRQILFQQNYTQSDMYFCLLLLKSPRSSLFVISPPPPPPQKNTSEHHGQQVSSYFSLILSKLRSNQNVVIKFIDYHTT